MTGVLAELVRQLDLRPGQSVRETVNGYTVELRILDDDQPTPELAEQVMLQPWVEFPDPPGARRVTPRLGPPQLPAPIVIDESDLAPE